MWTRTQWMSALAATEPRSPQIGLWILSRSPAIDERCVTRQDHDLKISNARGRVSSVELQGAIRHLPAGILLATSKDCGSNLKGTYVLRDYAFRSRRPLVFAAAISVQKEIAELAACLSSLNQGRAGRMVLGLEKRLRVAVGC